MEDFEVEVVKIKDIPVIGRSERGYYSVLDIIAYVCDVKQPQGTWARLNQGSAAPRAYSIVGPSIVYERIEIGKCGNKKLRPAANESGVIWLLQTLAKTKRIRFRLNRARVITKLVGSPDVVFELQEDEAELDLPPTIWELEGRNEVRLSVDLAKILNGKAQVSCRSGVIDVLTREAIIEIKLDPCGWKSALGQVLAYYADYSTLRKEIWIRGKQNSFVNEVVRTYGVEIYWFDCISDMTTYLPYTNLD